MPPAVKAQSLTNGPPGKSLFVFEVCLTYSSMLITVIQHSDFFSIHFKMITISSYDMSSQRSYYLVIDYTLHPVNFIPLTL